MGAGAPGQLCGWGCLKAGCLWSRVSAGVRWDQRDQPAARGRAPAVTGKPGSFPGGVLFGCASPRRSWAGGWWSESPSLRPGHPSGRSCCVIAWSEIWQREVTAAPREAPGCGGGAQGLCPEPWAGLRAPNREIPPPCCLRGCQGCGAQGLVRSQRLPGSWCAGGGDEHPRRCSAALGQGGMLGGLQCPCYPCVRPAPSGSPPMCPGPGQQPGPGLFARV